MIIGAGHRANIFTLPRYFDLLGAGGDLYGIVSFLAVNVEICEASCVGQNICQHVAVFLTAPVALWKTQNLELVKQWVRRVADCLQNL